MKSFIIHLSKIDESLRTATELKKQLHSFDIDSELFEGTYGNEVGEIFKKENRKCHPWTFKGPQKLLSEQSKAELEVPGVMGCFYSHFRLWKKCIELAEPIMIFEDDAVIYRGYIPVEWKDVLILVFGNATKSAKYYHYLTDSSGKACAEKYTRSSMPGTPGYAIKPHAAKKLVDMYEKTFLPSDNAINKSVVEIEVHSYAMGKALLGVDGKKSLVRRKDNFWSEFDKCQ